MDDDVSICDKELASDSEYYVTTHKDANFMIFAARTYTKKPLLDLFSTKDGNNSTFLL